MTKLETITAEDLQNRTYEPTHFLVDELIPEGLHILAGAPKIGKSWLALWLCLCVSQGQALWNFATTQGEALYLSLEDSFQRIQMRLFDLTEDAPPTTQFCFYRKRMSDVDITFRFRYRMDRKRRRMDAYEKMGIAVSGSCNAVCAEPAGLCGKVGGAGGGADAARSGTFQGNRHGRIRKSHI
ncbi:MAG: AAA family ATPase [Oscillospiraceae bacterium]